MQSVTHQGTIVTRGQADRGRVRRHNEESTQPAGNPMMAERGTCRVVYKKQRLLLSVVESPRHRGESIVATKDRRRNWKTDCSCSLASECTLSTKQYYNNQQITRTVPLLAVHLCELDSTTATYTLHLLCCYHAGRLEICLHRLAVTTLRMNLTPAHTSRSTLYILLLGWLTWWHCSICSAALRSSVRIVHTAAAAHYDTRCSLTLPLL